MRTFLAIFTLAVATLLGGTACLSAQDPPKDTGKPKEAGDPVPARGEPEKNGNDGAAADENPLDDQKMKQQAKLGKILAKKRCVICHKIEGKGGVLSPPIEQVTADRFKKMESYDQFVSVFQAKDPARYSASKKTLDAIAAEQNRYKKLMLWLKAYLDKPTFDNGQAKMTKQVLKAEEVDQLIAYMLTLEPKE